jgi:hypothetical protein
LVVEGAVSWVQSHYSKSVHSAVIEAVGKSSFTYLLRCLFPYVHLQEQFILVGRVLRRETRSNPLIVPRGC